MSATWSAFFWASAISPDAVFTMFAKLLLMLAGRLRPELGVPELAVEGAGDDHSIARPGALSDVSDRSLLGTRTTSLTSLVGSSASVNAVFTTSFTPAGCLMELLLRSSLGIRSPSCSCCSLDIRRSTRSGCS